MAELCSCVLASSPTSSSHRLKLPNSSSKSMILFMPVGHLTRLPNTSLMAKETYAFSPYGTYWHGMHMSCRMILGYMDKDIDAKGFKAVIKKGMQLAATPNLGDYFTCLGVRIDLSGQAKDFVDTMLAIMESGKAEFEFDHSHIKATLLDMLAASMDTSATTIEWVLSELLKHPATCAEKGPEGDRTSVGMDRMVEESWMASSTWTWLSQKPLNSI
ncbi:hypothetical protein RJ640_026176 [Escallonia rubra]|uniref:Uncharacterized protein n=1 Tax=Escallonia rubra TaxID=112253 RepID=A0AA88RG01_9ASTE|nr:hypothetical protein RJ640_026176 [Escallonia rubra]